jgi:hypothetical protein
MAMATAHVTRPLGNRISVAFAGECSNLQATQPWPIRPKQHFRDDQLVRLPSGN